MRDRAILPMHRQMDWKCAMASRNQMLDALEESLASLTKAYAEIEAAEIEAARVMWIETTGPILRMAA